MLDIKFVRENLEAVETAMKNRNTVFDKETFTNLEESRRACIAEEEDLQSKRNTASKKIGALMGQGKAEEAESAKEEVRQINEKLDSAKAAREKVDEDLRLFMLALPNIPHESTPVGADENDNPEIRK